MSGVIHRRAVSIRIRKLPAVKKGKLWCPCQRNPNSNPQTQSPAPAPNNNTEQQALRAPTPKGPQPTNPQSQKAGHLLGITKAPSCKSIIALGFNRGGRARAVHKKQIAQPANPKCGLKQGLTCKSWLQSWLEITAVGLKNQGIQTPTLKPLGRNTRA